MDPNIQPENNEKPVAIRMDDKTHLLFDITDPSKCCFKATGISSCACLIGGAIFGTCAGCSAWLCHSSGITFLWGMIATGFGGAAVCGGCGLLTCYCVNKHGQSFCTRCGCHSCAQEFHE
jgi:hypothetical protein